MSGFAAMVKLCAAAILAVWRIVAVATQYIFSGKTLA